MPVRGPALVHDLAREHGVEVERLFAHGSKDVALPLLELRRVLRDEPEQVALGRGRQARALALELLLGRNRSAGEVVEALLEAVGPRRTLWLDILGITLPAQALERIDVRFEGQGGVEHLL